MQFFWQICVLFIVDLFWQRKSILLLLTLTLEDQRATATAVPLMSVYVGLAVGFLHPVLAITSGPSTQSNLKMYFAVKLGETIFILVMSCFYEDNPPTPPSSSNKNRQRVGFTESFRQLAANKDYILVALTYGITIGLQIVVSLLLNPLVSRHYPDQTVNIGIMGSVNQIIPVVTLIAVGRCLDKYHNYKTISLVSTSGSFLLWAMFAVALVQNSVPFSIVFASFVVFSFFMQSISGVGIEQV